MSARSGDRAADYVRRPLETTVDGLTAEMCGWLAKQPEFRQLRINARGAHPQVYAYLTAATVVGQEWASSVTGTTVANTPEQAPESRSWVTSSEAAQLLGIGARAVVQAIDRDRLEATNVAGRWQIERDDLEHYRATRTA